ncbi:nodulation protein NfeD [Shewanella sp. MBTL60-112-B2]|uniref:NfeD family protein n=1 Tax=Shewanella sp. MBTL60-112-B2 TaxID=2815917 RepID=UPI001C7EBC7A|nr:nodulation protein NfeD [Shewanella sp. MBTL60-112-B2]
MLLNKLPTFGSLLLVTVLLQLCFCCAASYANTAQQPNIKPRPQVVVLEFEGAIGPATSEYLTHGIDQANASSALGNSEIELIVIVMDTPGGLVSSLRDINQSILNSEVPIACLVAPPGARAASAGTYILYACHIAAMADATTLGAATPVSIGPGSAPTPAPKQDPKDDKEPAPATPSAMEKKILNDAIAYIRALAQLRGRNEQWAELAVKEAATLTAKEALEMNVINLISPDAPRLVNELTGWQVEIDNQQLTLALDNAELHYLKPDWRNRIISTITNPNVAYILMLIGIYGILLEFYSPGIGIAGITGAISLLVALYAFQMLPISYAGLGLLLLGLALITIESFAPSFGIFGLGGIAAFAIGSLFLLDTETDHFVLSLPLVAAVSVAVTLMSMLVLGTLWRNRKSPIVSGDGQIVGQTALVVDDFTPSAEQMNAAESSASASRPLKHSGFVLLNGEIWAASSDYPLKKAQQVTVVIRHDLSLEVKLTPASHQEVLNS